jgi:hypothetical protein
VADSVETTWQLKRNDCGKSSSCRRRRAAVRWISARRPSSARGHGVMREDSRRYGAVIRERHIAAT